MPEGLEAEIWRRACTPLVGRRIVDVVADARVVSPDVSRIVDAAITDVRRLGKVVLVDTEHGTLGLHFGMTGRLVVDGVAPIERLAYASGRDAAEWDRCIVSTEPRAIVAGRVVPALRFNDPRRLGRVSIDPDLDHLGVDIGAVTPRRLTAALLPKRTTIKNALLDQTVVAGLGNLCADEVLWWAGLDPHRRVDSMESEDVAVLAQAIRSRLPVMLRSGGSTAGVLGPDARAQCLPCERDGTPLRRDTISGRTAVWCPEHQR